MDRIPGGGIFTTESTEGDGRGWKQQKEWPEKTSETFVFFGPLGFSSGSDSVLSVRSVVKGLGGLDGGREKRKSGNGSVLHDE